MNFSAALPAAAIALVVTHGPALASGTLTIPGWYDGYSAVSVSLDVDGASHSNVLLGPFRATFTPTGGVAETVEGPLYCLDIYHSFSWGQTWDVTCYTIPPDTPPAPPYNVEHAAYIYNRFGYDYGTNANARAVQLAMWEVSHEGETGGVADWIAQFDAGTSWTTGTFKGSGSTFDTIATRANDYLADLRAHLAAVEGGGTFDQGQAVVYYEPYDGQPGQGQMGRARVPEPGVLLVLGTTASLFCGAQLRRRRRTG